MTLNVVSTAERPELVPTVAGWVWTEFWRGHGHTLEQTLAAVSETVTARDLPQTYVLLADGRPVGTASLAAKDLEERPELTPWLAGVFVEPESRGHGYAGRLTAHVEGVCVKTLDRHAVALHPHRRARLCALRLANGREHRAQRQDLRVDETRPDQVVAGIRWRPL